MSVEARAEYFRANAKYENWVAAKAEVERELPRAQRAVEAAWGAAIKEANAELDEYAGEGGEG